MKRTKATPTTTLAVGILAAASVLVPAGAASAADTAECDGVVTRQTFQGNVRVPDGGSCVLSSSTIKGTVIVGADADLVLTSSVVDGTLTQEPRSFVSATKSTIGNLGARAGYGAQLTDTTVRGSLSAFARGEVGGAEPQVYLTRATLGAVRGEQFTMSATSSKIGTFAVTRAVDDIILTSSTVGSSAIDFTQSVALCGNTFNGAASFYYAQNLISGSADAACAGNRYNDALSVRLATGTVEFYGNTVAGSANAQGVTNLKQGRNVFRGPVSGQFSSASARTSVASTSTTGKRGAWGSKATKPLVSRAKGKKAASAQQRELTSRQRPLTQRSARAVAEARAKGTIRL